MKIELPIKSPSSPVGFLSKTFHQRSKIFVDVKWHIYLSTVTCDETILGLFQNKLKTYFNNQATYSSYIVKHHYKKIEPKLHHRRPQTSRTTKKQIHFLRHGRQEGRQSGHNDGTMTNEGGQEGRQREQKGDKTDTMTNKKGDKKEDRRRQKGDTRRTQWPTRRETRRTQ